MDDAPEVDLQRLLDGVVVGVEHPAAAEGDAGVVVQLVHDPEVTDDVPRPGRDRRAVGDVDDRRVHARPRGLRLGPRGGQATRVEVAEREIGSAPGQFDRQRAPDARAGTRDRRDDATCGRGHVGTGSEHAVSSSGNRSPGRAKRRCSSRTGQ